MPDIREGALFAEMPKCGFGRILSDPEISERYATLVLFGRRLFCAWGNYGLRRFRWYLVKNNA